MILSSSTKRLLPWLFFSLVILSVVYTQISDASDEKKWQLALTLVGASAAFVHFLYTRHHEETKMFRKLFREFNERYNELNDKMNTLALRAPSYSLTGEDITTLYDYFNLCAEEFFYYRSGYIPEEVWNSWRRGMQIFLSVPSIRDLLKAELKNGSYYHLTFDEIERPVKDLPWWARLF